MIIAHDLAHNLGALAVGTIGSQSHIAHADQNAPMNGLQAITYIGQGTPDDDTHRVVDIRPSHLVFDIDRNDVRRRRWRCRRGGFAFHTSYMSRVFPSRARS